VVSQLSALGKSPRLWVLHIPLTKEVNSTKENPGATNLVLFEYHHWIYFGRLKGWNVASNDSHSYEKR
jgi:hypothetical protein